MNNAPVFHFRLFDLLPIVVYRRLENTGLLLLGSDLSAMKGCIDVWDLREKAWMVSEEFDRKEDGPMPWVRTELMGCFTLQ